MTKAKKGLFFTAGIALATVFMFSCSSDGGLGDLLGGTAPAIATSTLPNGAVNTAYSQALVASGSAPTWGLQSGALPPGLSIMSNGVISGIPTTAGTFIFIVNATNASGSDMKELSITIATAGENPNPNPNPGGSSSSLGGGSSSSVGGGYNIGDTGPGGGIIFYVSTAGFTVEMLDPEQNYRANYLEAAPPVTERLLAWASEGYFGTGIATVSGIGAGRKSTDLILATDAAAPGALYCKSLTTGGKTDWFLPSQAELRELYRQRSLFGDPTGEYMCAQENTSGYYWTFRFSNDNNPYYQHKSTTTTVRAIRAF